MATPGGLTPKQEKFVNVYIETSNASEAYRQAYDVREGTKPESIWQAASRVLSDVKVSARVVELQDVARSKSLVTVQSITDELNENRMAAAELDQPAAMNAATLGKAKLHGLLVDKQEQAVTINAVKLGSDVDGV